jgi:hypothetical protein
MNDEALVSAFRGKTLPSEAWTHQAHLRMAWLYLNEYSIDEAHVLLRVAIIRLNDAHGLQETVTRGYHETLTRVWLTLVAAGMKSCAAPTSAEFLGEQLGSLGKDAVLQYYSRERLMSARARAVFVEPDIKPLPV